MCYIETTTTNVKLFTHLKYVNLGLNIHCEIKVISKQELI